MKEGINEAVPFSLNELKEGKNRVVTLSGFIVTILTTEADDPHYKIQGYIGKSTQLESWTTTGKYYYKEKKKEKYNNQNNLILTK